MADKRMLILDAEVMKRIDENRGDMSYSEFINFLIDNQLKESHTKDNIVTKEDLQRLEKGVKEVLHSFLEFFLSYGLELGKPPTGQEFAELDHRLQGLDSAVLKGKKS